jgi:hypothetical protein
MAQDVTDPVARHSLGCFVAVGLASESLIDEWLDRQANSVQNKMQENPET